MAEHRAKSLSALLSIALATGYSEIEPYLELLKVRAGLLVATEMSEQTGRTLTPILQWGAMTPGHALRFPISSCLHQKRSKCVLLLFGNPGSLERHDNLYLTPNGWENSRLI